jgi:oxygen-independent coproporphyrinogen III oxidase
MGLTELVAKYSVPGPRYTSYPTAPQWTEAWGEEEYRERLRSPSSTLERDPLALYVHIPFCESLCYYCGCNIQITHDHSRSSAYVKALLKELETLAGLLQTRKVLSQVAWGGGTPTFLSLEEIRLLQEGIRKHFSIDPKAEISIEIDPRVTSKAQLELLRELGFNRVSLGVQDFDIQVQKAVNREQSAEMTEDMLNFCRTLGFTGINFDLIYGLPHQSLESFHRTVDKVLEIRPDRIALYNYAHLPSLRPHQKILEKFPMPEANTRLEIFVSAYERLIEGGYRSIGMDHFALPSDELSLAADQGKLYRNFMGYTVKRGAGLLGVGASAIGEFGGGFFQNVRETKLYEERVAKTGLAAFRGCLLSDEDQRRQWIIQALMCGFTLSFDDFEKRFGKRFEELYENEWKKLEPLREDGIVDWDSHGIHVSQMGRLFVRNVAMQFDAYLQEASTAFSKTL